MTRRKQTRPAWWMLLTCSISLVLAATALAFTQPVPPASQVLGVVQEAKVDGKTSAGLRVLFRHARDGWQAACPPRADACSFPQAKGEHHWFLSGSGKSGDAIVTEGILAPDAFSTGLLRIVSGLPPFEGSPNLSFAGWTGEAVHKPLVVTDQAGSLHPIA